jgi:hypothetical protein
MKKSRFVVGILCCVVAVLLLVFGSTGGTTSGAVAFAILGIAMIAISRRRGG